MRSMPCAMSPSASLASSRMAPPRRGPLLGAAVGNGTAAYRQPAMKRFADSLVRQKASSPRPATKRRSRSAASSSTNTRPREPTVKRLGSSNPNRSVRPSCCTPRRSRKGKASSFPTRPRPTRPRCLRGDSNRDTKRRRRGRKATYKPAGSSSFNRPGRRKDLGNAKLPPMPLGSELRPAKFDSRDAAAIHLR